MTISVGTEATKTFLVGEADTAVAMGSGDVPVLGTPRLIAWCEEVTVLALQMDWLPAAYSPTGMADPNRAVDRGYRVKSDDASLRFDALTYRGMVYTVESNIPQPDLDVLSRNADGTPSVVFAGAIDFDAGLRLVHARGRAMQDASDANPSGMVSILGLERGEVEAPIDEQAGSQDRDQWPEEEDRQEAEGGDDANPGVQVPDAEGQRSPEGIVGSKQKDESGDSQEDH